jgi:branched-chain amino acid transport system ATP-binding protein
VALLELRDVGARYGEIEVLRGIDLRVEEGTIVALLGANGAGKTTTLRAVSGAVATTGAVRFAGRELRDHAPEDAARLGIAHVPEGRGTLGALTVRENLQLGAYLLPAARARTRYRTIVASFPLLEQRAKQIAGTLSGGEQQMLAIARALMMEPRLVLIDEPSLGLAPLAVREVFALLRTVNERDRVTIVVAEQNATAALAIASYGYVLETGRVATEGAHATLLADPRVRTSYLGY